MENIKDFLKKIGRGIVKGAIRIYFAIVYRVEVIGTENIPKDKNEPLIYCGNHMSYADPPIIAATAKRHVRFLAKEELRKNPFLAFLGMVFDVIYVKRDSKDVATLKTVLKAIKNKESIALFPEGTRNGLEKGEKVKDGAAFIAIKTGARVIPVGISGGEKPFKKMTVKYGEPLDYRNKSKDDLEEVTNEIMENIIKLTK